MKRTRAWVLGLIMAVALAVMPSQAFAATPWTRLGGDTAWDTMKLVVNEAYPTTSKYVIVASGDGYWDALSASGLAGCYDAPVVTTTGAALKQQAKDVLTRLQPEHVFVMGGKSAISEDCLAQIKAACPSATVERVAGATAADTALEGYKKGTGSWGDTCIVATWNGYWDALSIAPYAFAYKAPIFLVSGNNALSDGAVGAITQNFEHVLVMGGTAVVPDAVVSTQLSGKKVTRLWGQNAMGTAVEAIKWEKANGMGSTHITVATANDYYDALAGAPLAGKSKSVIALVKETDIQPLQEGWSFQPGETESGYILGGTAAVTDATFARMQAYEQGKA